MNQRQALRAPDESEPTPDPVGPAGGDTAGRAPATIDPDLPRDRAALWRMPALGGMEVLRATFVAHTYGRHTHDEYAIGTIERGAQTFAYRGAERLATPGVVVVIEPGEVHTGRAAAPEGYAYRMLYPNPDWLRRAASELADRPRSAPVFPDPVVHDPPLAGAVRALHLALEEPAPRLECEARLLSTLTAIVARHGEDRPSPRPVGRESPAVARARAYLEDSYAEDLTLADLAAVVALSPFQLARVFRAAVGLPPHAYLDQVRVRHAKRLLAAGLPIAEAALAVGFADQSHLTRRFKRLVGVTPGVYQAGSKNVQDGTSRSR